MVVNCLIRKKLRGLNCKRKIIALLCLLLFTQIVNSQFIHKPQQTAEQLTKEIIKGKIGDEGKFKAIFDWVATNIKYNYNIYYSSNGTFDLPIKTILFYKSGVCLHYAKLMDTLCGYAGIPNISI